MLQANKPVRIFSSGTGNAAVSFLGRTKCLQSTGDTWLLELDTHDYGWLFCRKEITGEFPALRDRSASGRPSVGRPGLAGHSSCTAQSAGCVIPVVYTVVSRDVCQNDDLHPKDKKQLSKRIVDALAAL